MLAAFLQQLALVAPPVTDVGVVGQYIPDHFARGVHSNLVVYLGIEVLGGEAHEPVEIGTHAEQLDGEALRVVDVHHRPVEHADRDRKVGFGAGVDRAFKDAAQLGFLAEAEGNIEDAQVADAVVGR